MTTLQPRNAYYDISPRIVLAGSETEIAVRPLYDHVRFSDKAAYEVTYHPREEIGSCPPNGKPPFGIRNGTMFVRQRFEGEQEHILVIAGVLGERKLPPLQVSVYSLLPDLYERRPYKGDFHLHSTGSDGRESPAYMAASCRGIGCDFTALTDHHNYASSLAAIEAFSGVAIDLRIFPGEEVHAPDNPIHIVNYGGAFSVNDLFKNDEARYRAEVQAIEDNLTGLAPDRNKRYQYASCLWIYDKIRQGGGLAIFCHPYWICWQAYNAPELILARHIEDMPFDALELIGGFHLHEAESNSLQVARYHEERARGRRIPIVGASDAHWANSEELFGWYYTIVFAHSTGLNGIIESVRNLYSVAIEALPNHVPHVHGPFRLVKYAWFLLREFFPLHDRLCVEEGRLMLDWAAGERSAGSQLAALRGRAAGLMARCFGEQPK